VALAAPVGTAEVCLVGDQREDYERRIPLNQEDNDQGGYFWGMPMPHKRRMSVDYAELRSLVEAHRQELLDFAQRLVQKPSMPGEEGEVAALLLGEMQSLGYDQVWRDEAGNVIGHVGGEGGPSLMFNGHMDHVDAGDPSQWAHPPFGGEVHDEALWGRATVDMKGALAAMVYAGGLVRELGLTPPGDLYVSGVVQEEVGGLGSRYLSQTLPVDRAVVGEASGNHLRRGHRGRVELRLHLEGRAVHASMPDLGANPHFSLARFLDGLVALEMVSDKEYGASTVAPTLIASEPQSANVTPSNVNLVLDWRNIPGEQPKEIVAKLEALLNDSLQPGCRGRVQLATKALVSYSGFQMTYPDTFPSFTTPAAHPWLLQARECLAAVLEREMRVGAWRFATDGGHFAAAGATVLGFGPGDEALVHTIEEHLPIDQLEESALGYLVLALL
jgi:putative selenium metabolism hydrolase